MDRFQWLEDQPEDEQVALRGELHGLLTEVDKIDGVPALSEAYLRGIEAGSGHRHLLAIGDAGVEGILAVDGTDVEDAGVTVELAVRPRARRRGIASELLRTASRGLDADSQVNVWAHGNLEAARGLASGRDARTVRELLKMSVDCSPGTPQRQALLDGAAAAHTSVEDAGLNMINYATACDTYGVDQVDAEWLRVNNEAFAWHPEQGGWDVQKLQEARDTDWFDPAGVVMLWSTGDPTAPLAAQQDQLQGVPPSLPQCLPQCLGVHWTKRPDGDSHGEVYVVCLADAARGKGLGGPLTLLGIEYLIDGGAMAVDLYVEGDNVPAVATYRKLGFTVVHSDVVYRGMV